MTLKRFVLLVGGVLCSGILPVFAQEAYFYSEGKKWPLTSSHAYVAVQTQAPLPEEKAKRTFRSVSDKINWGAYRSFAGERVALLPVAHPSEDQERQLVTTLRRERSVNSLFKVYGGQRSPMIVTGDLVVQFKRAMAPVELQGFAARYKIEFVKALGAYAPNGYLCRVLDPRSQSALQISDLIYEHEAVRFSHPDFIWPKSLRFVPNDPLFPQQWHLKNTGQSGAANADVDAPDAWDITQGSSSITIAVIDPTGTDIDHEDFQAPGKIVPGYNFQDHTNNPRPGPGDDHATAVAGIATAVGNNGIGVTGIAPGCKLMAIKLGDTTSSEGDSFNFAANNGADVITNSWGPPDDGNYPQPLPDVTRAGIDYAAQQGRGGKGCAIFWAAGNGGHTESTDFDGYASYSKVINVAASNDMDRVALYSETGQSLAVSAPSSDFGHSGIVTTDRMGSLGYSAGNYTTDFGGTSASSPLAAGIGALMLSVNPGLTWQQVKEILEQTADKIDPAHGAYDSAGHSTYYGFGRVNAFHAVQKAKTALPARMTVTSITPSSAINNGPVNITLLAGTGFNAGATVKLTRSGESDIVGTNVSVPSPTKITCTFNVTGRTPGLWSVVVANPDAQTETLQNGFTLIADTNTHDVAVTSFTASPNPVTRGAKITFNVSVKNLGAVTENGVTFKLTYNGKLVTGVIKLPSWKPGQTLSGSIPVIVPRNIPAGDYLVTAQLSTVTGEVNTDNNSQTLKITVQ